MASAEEPLLSGMVICLNEERRIGACLSSLAFCDEVVVIDSGSRDRTVALVEASGARLFTRPFVSWNDQKDFGRRQCRGRWVLNVDADEVVSAELAQEIRQAIAAAPEEVAGYAIPFRNHLRDRWLRGAGFYPDPHLRLIRRERGRWDDSAVHDRVRVEGMVRSLRGHIDHYSFESIADYLEKSNIYAEAFARDAFGRGRRTTAIGILFHAFGRFLKMYLLRGGIRFGRIGVIMAGLQAAATFQKYARLWELEQFPEEAAAPSPALGDPWAKQRLGSETER
jgi:glycosyltransferase involved in cell wall biosynthesis